MRARVFGPSTAAAQLDALAAAGIRSESSVRPTAAPGRHVPVEPFALRALGIVRGDDDLLARAQERFAALGLHRHAAQTDALASGRVSRPAGAGRPTAGRLPWGVGQLLSGRYEIERVVGSGGMATGLRAFDTVLERPVALKVLDDDRTGDDESLQRFRHEARAAAQLAHPNIVAVLDRGEQDGRQFIVFEHVEGETLKERVAREGALPIREVAEIGAAVARALDCAHANGVVHRDVKPQNVLLTEPTAWRR